MIRMAIRRHKVGCLEDVAALRVVEVCTLYQGLGLEQLSDRRGAEEGQAKLAALAISISTVLYPLSSRSLARTHPCYYAFYLMHVRQKGPWLTTPSYETIESTPVILIAQNVYPDTYLDFRFLLGLSSLPPEPFSSSVLVCIWLTVAC
jgi:hypothetical protein